MSDRGQLFLLRRRRSYRKLFFATSLSALGTYVAAIALTVHVYDRTGSGAWVAALLVADFLPIVVIGLTLGPLIDRLSRKRLMIAADVVRAGVFVALTFVDSPAAVVALAGVAGIATGFFRPAVYAGLPNMVKSADELTNANSLLTAVENASFMLGPVIGGVLVAVADPDFAYWINAVSFLVSAVLVARIRRQRLQSRESLSRGHWRDVADGIQLVLTSQRLRTVLIVWNLVMAGNAAVNVSEIVFAKDDLGAGNVGFGLLVAATGLGITLGSLSTPFVLGAVGLRRMYVGSIGLMGIGMALASMAPSLWIAAPLACAATFGNGAAIVCNQLFIQRGAPDQMRGRAVAVLMSSTYATLAVAMAGAGVLTGLLGGRTMWALGGGIWLCCSVAALALTRNLGVQAEEHAVRRDGVEAGDAVSTSA
jgi:MFS family permease